MNFLKLDNFSELQNVMSVSPQLPSLARVIMTHCIWKLICDSPLKHFIIEKYYIIWCSQKILFSCYISRQKENIMFSCFPKENLHIFYRKLQNISVLSVRDEKLQYDIKREAAKISALSSGKIDKYKYLAGEEILPSNRSQKIKQVQFTFFSWQIASGKNRKICCCFKVSKRF